MANHNGLKFLENSINSILNQTWQDFEFLIVDDGSSDNSVNYIISIKDPRIKLLKNLSNIGLTKSLIRGMNEAKAKFIARMDVDDLSNPTRLARQVSFFKGHPEVIICGQNRLNKNFSYSDLFFLSHFETPFIHSSVMIKKEYLRYDSNIKYAQDLGAWRYALGKGQGKAITDLVNYNYYNPDSISKTRSAQQLDSVLRQSSQLCERAGITPDIYCRFYTKDNNSSQFIYDKWIEFVLWVRLETIKVCGTAPSFDLVSKYLLKGIKLGYIPTLINHLVRVRA